MANATKEQAARYHLELDENEAQTLVDILSAIGGDPNVTRRKYSDEILEEMESAGIVFIPPNDKEGSIRFK